MGWQDLYGESKRGVRQSLGQLSDTALRLKELRENKKQQKFQNLMNLGQLGMQGIGLASQLKTGKQARGIAAAGEARAQELHGPALEAAKMEPSRVQATIDAQKATTDKMEQDIKWVGMQMTEYPATIEHQRNIENLQAQIEQDKATVARLDAEWRQAQTQYEPQKLELLGKQIENDAKELDVRLQEAQTRLDIAKLQLAGLNQEQAQAILPVLSQARDLWLQSRPQYLDVNGMPDPSKWYTDAGKQDFKKFLIESGEAQNLGIDPAQQDTILDAFWGGEAVEDTRDDDKDHPDRQRLLQQVSEEGFFPTVEAKLDISQAGGNILDKIASAVELIDPFRNPAMKKAHKFLWGSELRPPSGETSFDVMKQMLSKGEGEGPAENQILNLVKSIRETLPLIGGRKEKQELRGMEAQILQPGVLPEENLSSILDHLMNIARSKGLVQPQYLERPD